MRPTVCLLALLLNSVFGQNVAPVFEAASVRQANSQAVGGGFKGGSGTDDPGRISYSNLSLVSALMRAYHVQLFQISGPDWLKTERYDIAAKIPEGATQPQFDLMLQNLLVERFHLGLHHETRDFRAYELTGGKNGPKLKDSVPNAGAEEDLTPVLKQFSPTARSIVLAGTPLITSARVLIAGRARTIEWLSAVFQNMILGGVPVVDETGLTGKYDFTLEFEPLEHLAGGDPGNQLPNIFTAVQEELGLKLEEKKLPFDVLVIDHADKVPTEN